MYVAQRINANEVWYKPNYRGNRELPEDKCFKVLIRPLTQTEMRTIESANTSVTKLHDKTKVVTDWDAVCNDIVKNAVLKVEGAETLDPLTGEKKKIETAADLIQYDNGEVLNELFIALRDHSVLSEGIKKNSSMPLDSTGLQTPKSEDGGALGATQVLNQDKRAEMNTMIQNSDSQTMINAESATATENLPMHYLHGTQD